MTSSQAFHQASNAGLKSYGRGVLGFGALTILALLQVPGVGEIYEQLLKPQLYLPALIAVTFFYGVVLASATRDVDFIQRFVTRYERQILQKLALFCGCILGWTLAVCLVHVAINDPRSAPLTVVLTFYAAILTLFPIWAFANVLVISKAYREFSVREKRWPWLITGSGWLLIAASVIFGYRMV